MAPGLHVPFYSAHTLKLQRSSPILVPKILRPGPYPQTYPLNFPKNSLRPSLQRPYTKITVSIHYRWPRRPCSHFSFFSLFFSLSTSGRRQNAHKFVSKGGVGKKVHTNNLSEIFFRQNQFACIFSYQSRSVGIWGRWTRAKMKKFRKVKKTGRVSGNCI